MDTQVDFPMKSLDMSAFTVRGVNGTKLGASNSHLYDLAAVIVHHGSGYASTSIFHVKFICKLGSGSFVISFNVYNTYNFYIFIKIYQLR